MSDEDLKKVLTKHYGPALQEREQDHVGAPPPFPGGPSLYQGEIKNLPDRPVDYMSLVAESLSPTMGAYGAGQMLAQTYGNLRDREWSKAAETGLPLLGIFAGPGAKTADLGMLARAQEMAGKGIGRDAIWGETGWFQGPDQKWRFEIPDNAMGAQNVREWLPPKEAGQPQMAPNFGTGLDVFADKIEGAQPAVGDMFHHRLLSEAYPQGMMDTPIGAYADAYSRGAVGLLSDGRKAIGLNEVLNPIDAKSTVLHELQHMVQGQEGFSPGASLGDFTYQNSPLLAQRKSWESPIDAYRRVAGEVEARNVQARQHMTPEERMATPPWETEDIPTAQQILADNYGGPQMSVGDRASAYGLPTRGYHGTLHDFNEFRLSPDYMVDRSLGVHFAKDPEVSNSFVMERVNGQEVGPKEGGRVIQAYLPDEERMLTVDQPVYDAYKDMPNRKAHQGIKSDQVAIEQMVAIEAYRQDPSILARYLTEARRIPESEAVPLAAAMARGETVKIPLEDRPMDLRRFVDNYGGKPYNEADRILVADLARKSWARQGYKGLKYINTSPMEMATAKDPTSYIVFDPSDIRSFSAGFDPAHRASADFMKSKGGKV